LDRKLGELQSRYGRYRGVKILEPAVIRTQSPLSSSLQPVATSTGLPRQKRREEKRREEKRREEKRREENRREEKRIEEKRR
jgi:hypothetical protein